MNRRIKKKRNKRLTHAYMWGHYEGYDWVWCKSYKEIRKRRREYLAKRYVRMGVDMNESQNQEEN